MAEKISETTISGAFSESSSREPNEKSAATPAAAIAGVISTAPACRSQLISTPCSVKYIIAAFGSEELPTLAQFTLTTEQSRYLSAPFSAMRPFQGWLSYGDASHVEHVVFAKDKDANCLRPAWVDFDAALTYRWDHKMDEGANAPGRWLLERQYFDDVVAQKSAANILAITEGQIREIVERIPPEWCVSAPGQPAAFPRTPDELKSYIISELVKRQAGVEQFCKL